MSPIPIIGKMPELPKAPPPIFTIPTPHVSETGLLRLARTFKLEASEKTGSTARDASSFTYSEGPFDLTLHRSTGAFRFRDRARWQVDHRGNVDLSDAEAVNLARAHLRRYKLLPKDSRVLRVSRLHVAAAGPTREMQDHRVIDAAVCFQPMVRGVPLDGPGGKVIVYLDHEGNMTCLDHIVRRIGPVHKKVTQLRSPEDAVEEARRTWTKRGIAAVEVSEVRFCYFELGWNDRQQYLQPAYIVLATLIGPDRRIRTGDIFVAPAAANSTGSLVTPPARRVVQKPRAQEPRGRRRPAG
jgi:hypothetical protein